METTPGFTVSDNGRPSTKPYPPASEGDLPSFWTITGKPGHRTGTPGQRRGASSGGLSWNRKRGVHFSQVLLSPNSAPPESNRSLCVHAEGSRQKLSQRLRSLSTRRSFHLQSMEPSAQVPLSAVSSEGKGPVLEVFSSEESFAGFDIFGRGEATTGKEEPIPWEAKGKIGEGISPGGSSPLSTSPIRLFVTASRTNPGGKRLGLRRAPNVLSPMAGFGLAPKARFPFPSYSLGFGPELPQ